MDDHQDIWSEIDQPYRLNKYGCLAIIIVVGIIIFVTVGAV